jgi:hypothetical protein
VPLDPQSINCAARIVGNGSVIGTGFFLSVASEDTGAPLNYLVTAHHVINGQTALEVRVAMPNGLLADPIPVPNWYQPIEDLDLAVTPLSPRSYMRIGLEDQVIADRWLRGPDEPQELFPGSPIHYIGIFVPLDRVMARSGTIGALDQEGVPLRDRRMNREYHYPVHLVDCRSYGGFSGSPCFVELTYAGHERVATPSPIPPEYGEVSNLHHLSLLCGMFTMHMDDAGEQTNTEGVVSRYGVGIMLRSEEIRKALMTDELREERRNRNSQVS